MKNGTIISLTCASILLLLSPYPTLAFYPIIALLILVAHSYYVQIQQYYAYKERAKAYTDQWRQINNQNISRAD